MHIVEWLRPGDLKTGWDLYEMLEPIGIAARPEVPVTFRRVSTRAQLVAVVRTLRDEFATNGRIPLLHIETHGNDEGIGVSKEEHILWRDLMDELIPLNRQTGLRLTVVLAACEGIWGIQMLQPGRRAAAYLGLIGPKRTIESQALATAIQSFCRTAFERLDGNAAFKAMNDGIDPSEATFLSVSAQTTFAMVWRGYFQELCTEAGIERRLDSMEANAIAQRRAARLPDMSTRDKNRARALAREFLTNHRARFDELRRDFFFIAQFPENDVRFDVKFEDCQQTVAKPNAPV